MTEKIRKIREQNRVERKEKSGKYFRREFIIRNCEMMVEGTDTTVLLPRREGAKNFLTFSKRLIVKNS